MRGYSVTYSKQSICQWQKRLTLLNSNSASSTSKQRENGRTDQIVIPGRLPGLNEYINAERTNRFKAAGIKRKTQKYIAAFIKKAYAEKTLSQHNKPSEIHFTWIEPNNRRDLDNISFAVKFIQDEMVKQNVFPDDGTKYIRRLTHDFNVDKTDPRIIIEIKEI